MERPEEKEQSPNSNIPINDNNENEKNFNRSVNLNVSESVDKCKEWLLEKCTLTNLDSEIDFTSHVTMNSEEVICNKKSSESNNQNNYLLQFEDNHTTEGIGNALIKHDQQYFGDINISQSQHVIIGNVTYITGPIHITQKTSEIHLQNITQQVFLVDPKVTKKAQKLRIISRLHWLAQPAFSKTELIHPIKYIVIAHTATEEGFTQAENTLLIRLLQTYHIESEKLQDISFNFMIGSDGNVYQGRGWNLEGEHTNGFNKNSIAIAFVGCFKSHLPSNIAMFAAKALIRHGIELGVIPENYNLIGQCQCLPIESPGKKLFGEIKNWPQWIDLLSVKK